MSRAIECYPIEGASLIITQRAGTCHACHTARFVFVNRAGETRCAMCDRNAEEIRNFLLECCSHA